MEYNINMEQLADKAMDAGTGRRTAGVAAVGAAEGDQGAAKHAVAMKESMRKHEIPEGEDGQEPFAEMLAVMDIEQLIRFRHRLGKIGRKRMVKILTEEIAELEKCHGS
jgi:hypothetical protein